MCGINRIPQDLYDKLEGHQEAKHLKRTIFRLPFYHMLFNPDYQNKFGFAKLDGNSD
jgi:hypothetical protein